MIRHSTIVSPLLAFFLVFCPLRHDLALATALFEKGKEITLATY
jgi:hypothetical protein